MADVATRARAADVATLTTAAPHGLTAGSSATVAGVLDGFDGTHVVATVPDGTTLTYVNAGSDVTAEPATGTVTATAGLDLDLLGQRVADRLKLGADDETVQAAVEAAVQLVELDTGHARTTAELSWTDELLNRGIVLMAERVYHDPATQRRSVDAFGDESFTGPIIPARLRSGIAHNYWAHVGHAAPAVDEDGNPTETAWVHRGFA